QIIELPNHVFFIGAQFHPEFKSRPGKPSPLFLGLIAAASGQLDLLLKRSCSVISSKPTPPRYSTNGTGTAVLTIKPYPNGHAKKALTSLVNGCYANGNGIHI
uniref:CTP synthase (glutamine hydrolyzing) n=1 Tax=Aegilops tauschii subsp. strangulata TaxID=200361 RepID=A0A453F592_AEGTS